jgi:PAS domain S-box-containing protein
MTNAAETFWFLDHPGECAALLRHEMLRPSSSAETPRVLERWPSSMQAVVNLMLAAREPMLLAWGPERLMVYNDAYACLLGARHPQALFKPMSQVWQEVWPVVGPMVERVFQGESVQMDDLPLRLQRENGLHEAHFSFGFHPVRGVQRQVEGLFCVCREITSQLEAQRKREEELARRWRLFEQTPGFVAILRGPQHEIEFVNRAFETAFGPREFIGLPVVKSFPEARSQGFIDRLDKVWHSGERFEGRGMPFWLQTPGRSEALRRLDFIFEPLLEDNAVSGIFVQGHDVTDLHQAQENARAGDQRYVILLDSMSEGLLMLDAQLHVLQINRAGLRMDGRTLEQVVGLAYDEVWPGTAGGPVERACREALQTGQSRHVQHHHVGGTQDFWLDMHAYPVPGGLAVLYRDIGAVKLAEAALRQSEARFKAAVAAVGVMWTRSAQGLMVGAQPGWEALTGQTQPQYQGDGWVEVLHPEDAPHALAVWRQAVALQRSFVTEHRLRCGVQGPWRTYTVRAVPLLGADGALREWVGVHIDVTEAQRTAEALRSEAQRKDEFLAILAHELRNPLAPIRSAAQALGHPNISPQAVATCRDIITRQVRHMAWLLDDLLEISRITAGRLELNLSYKRLRDVVASAVETAQPLLDAKAHRLTVQLPQHDIDVEVDDLRLSQVLSNLLLNAAKYTPRGGHVKLMAYTDAQGLRIDIIDNGIGIAADQLPRVFNMFSQLHRNGSEDSQGGLGIGLALARGLIELHGGQLEAASPGLGLGATFTVKLPAEVVDSQPMPLDERLPERATHSSDGLCVLIADDNADAAQSLSMLLGLEGHEVHVAYNGAAALSLAAQVRPQVAVLDIGMPGLNGHEVARQLRSQPVTAHMLILAVTGWGQQEDQRLALAAGFDHHFTKPVNPASLMAHIAAWRKSRSSHQPN